MKKTLDLFSLKHRVAVVTGACGQLGRQFVSALAEAGATVIATDMPAQNPASLAKHLQRKHRQPMLGMTLDVTSPESIERAVADILRRFRRIDILVNNAGIGVYTPWQKRTSLEMDQVTDINLKGTFWCTKIFSRSMGQRGQSSIINIGSIYGIVSPDPRIYGTSGRNSSDIYAMTKAGVVQMTRYMAVHLARHNIRVNCISPGGVFNRQKKSFVKNYALRTPLGRMANESDLKGAVVYLASDASGYVTGHNLRVDGGYTAW